MIGKSSCALISCDFKFRLAFPATGERPGLGWLVAAGFVGLVHVAGDESSHPQSPDR